MSDNLFSRHHPPLNDAGECAKPCPEPIGCEPVSGEYHFSGPTTIYSFNALDVFQVFVVDNGKHHPYGTFGGSAPFERHFPLCADYVIKWQLTGKELNCTVVAPVFYDNNKKCEALEQANCQSHITSISPSAETITNLANGQCNWTSKFPESNNFELHIPVCCEGDIRVSGENIDFLLRGLHGQIWHPPSELSCPITELQITADCGCISDFLLITQK